MSESGPSVVALIPARAGSTRLADKNIRPLDGHPLIAYTISAALESNVFSAVVVSTDSQRYAEIARYYGAETPFFRPEAISSGTSPDIDWVRHGLDSLHRAGRSFDCFSILRPTSPFRQADTIRRAWEAFTGAQCIDSLRAVEICRQHPGKMWVVRGERMTPLLPLDPADQPWHSSQYQALPEVYVQNASLEIAWSSVVEAHNTIAGHVVLPFFTQGHEGLDINEPKDWWYAEHLLGRGVSLPSVRKSPFLPSE